MRQAELWHAPPAPRRLRRQAASRRRLPQRALAALTARPRHRQRRCRSATRPPGRPATSLSSARVQVRPPFAAIGLASVYRLRGRMLAAQRRSPFALLPVRLETRFVRRPADRAASTAALGADLSGRLLGRHIRADARRRPSWPTRSLLAAIWRAGGVEADERAAWRGLVAAHGSGRAGYIVDTYQPTNLAAAPTKAQATDEILVIPTQTPLGRGRGRGDHGLLAGDLAGRWRRDEDAGGASRAARQRSASPRAAELDRRLPPFNLADRPPPPCGKGDVALSTAFVIFPPDPPTKQATWSQAPRVDHVPRALRRPRLQRRRR